MTGATTDVRRVAVVGSGVSGLTAAWVLAKSARVALYEADERLGGHAHTHRVPTHAGAGAPEVAVDSGFIVHNDRTYPTLERLFAELDIPTQETDMSMSVRCDGCGLEYAGAKGLRGLLGGPGARSVGHLRMLAEVSAFHRAARAELNGGPDSDRTLAQFLRAGRFSDRFTSHFMIPLVAAVWSCPPVSALEYPVQSLFTFLDHHGMLTVFGSPTWRTVVGGSATYVRAVADRLPDVRVGVPVRAVARSVDGVTVRDSADRVDRFDAVVIATHPNQALSILDSATPAEHEVLGALTYSPNPATLHTDTAVLPRSDAARASWNYRMPDCAARPDRVTVSYDLTRLHRLDETAPRRFVVTLGDGLDIDPATVINRMNYAHPQYTSTSVAAQRRLASLGDDRLAFAGAYHGWGFHEDGALSGLVAARRLGAEWTAAAPLPIGAPS